VIPAPSRVRALFRSTRPVEGVCDPGPGRGPGSLQMAARRWRAPVISAPLGRALFRGLGQGVSVIPAPRGPGSLQKTRPLEGPCDPGPEGAGLSSGDRSPLASHCDPDPRGSLGSFQWARPGWPAGVSVIPALRGRALFRGSARARVSVILAGQVSSEDRSHWRVSVIPARKGPGSLQRTRPGVPVIPALRGRALFRGPGH